MRYMARTRRDDIISLGYMLVYLNQGYLPFLQNLDQADDEYRQILEAKERCTPDVLCVDRSKIFLEFIAEVDTIAYEEAPDYTRLQFLLMKCMISLGEEMTNEYDWIIGNQ
jgi:hypothetical protein